MTTQLNINTEIKTERITENSEIIKTVIITKCPTRNHSGMEVEFKGIKGTYKAYINSFGAWTFMKGNTQLTEIK
jgi:hypothetical protein